MRPNLEQQRDFLLQTYFGVRGDCMDRFISRAYRDMNRTLRGVSKLGRNKSENAQLSAGLLASAKGVVRRHVEQLAQRGATPEEDSVAGFDRWHREACADLTQHYKEELSLLGSNTRLTHGQAQKWFNMTLKYCWAFGDEELDGLQRWYPVAHIAIDEVILEAVVSERVVDTRPCEKWSKWDAPEAYQRLQAKLRTAAQRQGMSPLELEFGWWAKYRPAVLGDSED
jgi:hypothetical protein